MTVTDDQKQEALMLMQAIAEDAGLEHVSTCIERELKRLTAAKDETEEAA